MKYIGIIGSRRRDGDGDYKKVLKAFKSIYEDGDTIVSGGCPKGGDRFAEMISLAQDVPIKIYKPKWNRYGIAAGFIRNTHIARRSDILIACVAEDRKGGTEDTIKKFLGKNGKENKVILV